MVNNFKSILSSLSVYCTSDSEVQRALTKSGWGDWDQIFEITLFSPTYQNSSSGYLIKIQRYQRVKAIKTPIFLNIKGIFLCTWSLHKKLNYPCSFITFTKGADDIKKSAVGGHNLSGGGNWRLQKANGRSSPSPLPWANQGKTGLCWAFLVHSFAFPDCHHLVLKVFVSLRGS